MKLAVTGGVAEGKSTVVAYLHGLGYKTASADAIARDLVEQPDIQHHISELLDVEFPPSRDILRARIAESTDFRRALNRVLHEPIVDRIEQSRAEIVEIPLLFEACLQWRFDKVWVVTCGVEEQIRRLMLRWGPKCNVAQILGTQLPSAIKIELADRVIRTNQSEINVLRYVKEYQLLDLE